jgi:hypothetical protein
MWAIIGILVAAVIIIIIELPSLLKKKLKKELWTFSFLLLIGTGVSIAKSLRMEISNPLDWISMVYKPISDAIFSFLK